MTTSEDADMPAALRAVIYARFSTDMQRDASIDDQIRACTEYAHRQGLEIVDTYVDRAISGASLMRSGIQKLMRDAEARRFDVVIAHALDRLSRNQADIAGLFQRLRFADIMIETVEDGTIGEMAIGLRGTMNAMQLAAIAAKTREGLRGRAIAGKSAGGISYGYDVVRQFDERGEPLRGDRTINAEEADVVRRIFSDYTRGSSPKKIAEQLNKEGVPGPQGGKWGASTIHGNRERGTGILNNELYAGRLVWNRQRYVKDPDTGRRVSRPNPEEQWQITEVPELRIVHEDLWTAARERQGVLKSKGTDTPVWDRRRPKFLLSKLMACGCCGGGFAKVSKDAFGCSTARNKGSAVCTNMLTIKREDLEARVLDALEHNLMDPELVEAFCEAYTEERNRLLATASAGRSELEKELAKVKRDHDRLVDAIVNGIPAEQVKDRMLALDQRKKALEAQLSQEPAASPLRIHPSMAATYRKRIGALIRGLGDAEHMPEAKEAVRALIDRIVLTPTPARDGLVIDLEGTLAALLCLATGRPLKEVNAAANAKKAPGGMRGALSMSDELVLVAGAGFEPATFRL